jgi:hypothetical protein
MLPILPFRLPPRCASCDGYSVHAGVVIGTRNRKGLERLCRYIARPSLSGWKVMVHSWSPAGGLTQRFGSRCKAG